MDAATIAETHGPLMLEFVQKTLAHGLAQGKPPAVNVDSFPEELRSPGATFVTVEKEGRLRGCIGSLQAHRPLVTDLVENAYRAGFKDPRFPPLSQEELEEVTFSISILSAPEPMAIKDEQDLLSQLVPNVDGLIIADQGRRATFLPQVWEQLPTPEVFLAHLKKKAGMAPNHWSDTFQALRYRVVKVG